MTDVLDDRDSDIDNLVTAYPIARPTISAIEMNSAAMKIATAMFPRFNSAGKSTSGVSRSMTR